MALHDRGTASVMTEGVATRLPNAILSGMTSTARLLRTSAGGRIALAMFRPGSTAAFFGEPLHELFGRTAPLDDLLPRADAERATARVAEAWDDARVAAVEALLLAQRRPAAPDAVVTAAVRALEESRGALPIHALARRVGVGQDPLEKRFRRVVGATPKQLASLFRLRHAIDSWKPGASLAELAQPAGYFDQSNFTRELRAVVGEPPGSISARRHTPLSEKHKNRGSTSNGCRVSARFGFRRRDSMKSERASTRREPKQQRSRQTVEAVLEAVQRVLRRHGAEAITTNRVAEVAGISIGSLYQYFPEKQAIFMALHDRHVDRVRHVIGQTMTQCTQASLEEFTRELVERLANVHSEDAELHEILSVAVPGSANGFKRALHATFEQVTSPTTQDRYTPEERERMLLVLPRVVETLVHGVAHQQQPLSRERAKDEAIRTVAVYLNSFQGG
jgi:AcrR family transcriptional regulator/AraC-like DNA-binding protein